MKKCILIFRVWVTSTLKLNEFIDSKWIQRILTHILFLNKYDLFKEKVKIVPLKNYFPDFNGLKKKIKNLFKDFNFFFEVDAHLSLDFK